MSLLGADRAAVAIADFIAESDSTMDWLDAALGNGDDLVDIAARAHGFAGSSAMFGATALNAALCCAETAARGGDQAALRRAVSAARQEWDHVRPDLSGLCAAL